jgi:hypothetical protein
MGGVFDFEIPIWVLDDSYVADKEDMWHEGRVQLLNPEQETSFRVYLDMTICHSPFSNAAEEEIASRSEAISDGAERVLNFSILYPPTHPHTHTHTYTYTHTPLHKTRLSTYMQRS